MRFRHLIWIHLFFITLYGESKETESINNQYNLKKYDALRIYFDCSIGNLKIRPSNNRYIVTSDISYSSILSKPKINLSDKNNYPWSLTNIEGLIEVLCQIDNDSVWES